MDVGSPSVPLPAGALQSERPARVRVVREVMGRRPRKDLPQYRADWASALVKPSERVWGCRPRRKQSEPARRRRFVGVRRHWDGVDWVGGINDVDCRLSVGRASGGVCGVVGGCGPGGTGRYLRRVRMWGRRDGEDPDSSEEEGWGMIWIVLLFVFLYPSLSAWN